MVASRPSGESLSRRGVGPDSEGLAKMRSRVSSSAWAGIAAARKVAARARKMRMALPSRSPGKGKGGENTMSSPAPFACREGSALGGFGLRRGGRFGLGLVEMAGVAALGDSGRLAGAAAQVIELRPADRATADDLDRIDVRRIEREDALDALAETDLAHGEGAAQAAIGAGDADAFEILDSGALALDDLHADAERVPRAEFGNVLARLEMLDRLGLELLDDVHLFLPSFSRRAPEGGCLRASP